MTERIRRRALIEGRVQGVFFRDTCRRLAARHGVAGSARNLPDGRVEIVLEGSPQAVAAVLNWCREGPPHARVTGVQVVEEQPQGLSGFTIA